MSGPVTIDTSVLVRATNLSEAGQQECEEVVTAVGEKNIPVILPTFVIPELAGVLGRRQPAPGSVEAIVNRIRRLPRVTFVPLDEALAEEAAELAVETKMRGADAIYVATARRVRSQTRHCRRGAAVASAKEVTAVLPAQFLAGLQGTK